LLIVDRVLEKKTIRFITAGKPSSNWLLGSLSADDFGNAETREAFKRIRKVARDKTDILTWDDLLHDPGLKEATRKSLALYKKKPTINRENAKALHRNLEKFRRSRAQFDGIADISLEFKKDTIDNDAIDAKLADIVNKSRSKAGEVLRTFTTGEGNNSTSLVKRILSGTTLTFLPTGFKAFDSVNHGITRGSLFVIGGTTGGGKCLTYESLVPTDKGILQLGEVYELLSKDKAVDGFRSFKSRVATHEGYANTDRSYRTAGRTWRMEAKNGDYVQGLPEHKLWLPNEHGQCDFVRLDKLKAGDWLPKSIGTRLFPRKVPCIDYVKPKYDTNNGRLAWDVKIPKLMTKELAEIMGWMACGVNVRLGLQIKDFLIEHIGAEKSAYKHVPIIVRQSPENIQVAFLRALFEGDGCVYQESTKKGKRWRIEYCSLSKQLVYQVKAMLENMGVLCSVGSGMKFAANGTDKQKPVRAWRLNVSPTHYDIFAKQVGFISKRKTEELALAISYLNNNESGRQALIHGDANVMPGRELVARVYDRMRVILPEFVYEVTAQNASKSYNVPWALKTLFDAYGTWILTHSLRMRKPGNNVTKFAVERILKAIQSAPDNIRKALLKDPELRVCLNSLKTMSKYYWTQVKTVGATKKHETVYDLSVPGPHSYHVNGLIGHNTALTLKLQSNFADSGAKTCIVSLEMTEDEVMVRNLSRYSKVELHKIIDPKNLSTKDRSKVKDAYKARVRHLKARGASETIHTPQDDMTLEDILFILKSYAYDVIIIDYISLLKNAGGDDAWQKLGDIARFAKVFAKNNGCIVVLLAQVSPEGMIRYSRAVEEHCITGDSLIETAQGLVSIETIMSNPKKYMVWGKDKKLHKVSEGHNNNIKPVYKLTTVDGNNITGTLKHQFLVTTSAGDVWLPMSKITKGMILAKPPEHKWPNAIIPLPEFKPKFLTSAFGMKKYPSTVTPSLGRFLGYLAGDGWITDECVGFVNTDKSVIDDYVECFEKAFGETPHVKIRRAKKKNGKLGKPTYVVAFYRQAFCEYVQTILGLKGRSHEKSIPSCILQSPKRVVTAFLSALYECDGCAGKNVVHYATTSEVMARQTRLLLKNFGLHVNTREVIGKKSTHRKQYHLTVAGTSNVAKFMESIGFITKSHPYITTWKKDSSKNWLGKDRLTVKSIEYVGRRQVFDVTVPATSHYIANGYVVHNSNNAWYFVRDAKSWESHIISIMQKKCRMGKMFPFDLYEQFEFMDVSDVPKEYLEKLEKQGITTNAGTPTRGQGERKFGGGRPEARKPDSQPQFKKKHTVDEESYFANDDDDEDKRKAD
jgi:intein/homing endonuclease/archaellum biogenesis ATPase FlaH